MINEVLDEIRSAGSWIFLIRLVQVFVVIFDFEGSLDLFFLL